MNRTICTENLDKLGIWLLETVESGASTFKLYPSLRKALAKWVDEYKAIFEAEPQMYASLVACEQQGLLIAYERYERAEWGDRWAEIHPVDFDSEIQPAICLDPDVEEGDSFTLLTGRDCYLKIQGVDRTLRVRDDDTALIVECLYETEDNLLALDGSEVLAKITMPHNY